MLEEKQAWRVRQKVLSSRAMALDNLFFVLYFSLYEIGFSRRIEHLVIAVDAEER